MNESETRVPKSPSGNKKSRPQITKINAMVDIPPPNLVSLQDAPILNLQHPPVNFNLHKSMSEMKFAENTSKNSSPKSKSRDLNKKASPNVMKNGRKNDFRNSEGGNNKNNNHNNLKVY